MSTSVDRPSDRLEALRALLDHSLDAVLIVDIETRAVLEANGHASDLLEQDRDSLTSLNLQDIVDQAGFSEILAVLHTASNQRAHVPAMIQTARGRKLSVNLSAGVDTFGDCEVGIVTLGRGRLPDDTSQGNSGALDRGTDDLDASRRELRDQEIRFRTLADSVPAGIFLTDAEGRLIYVNERWSKITGVSVNEAFQHGWLDGVHEDDRDRLAAAWNTFVTSPSTFELEFRFKNSEGEPTWVSARAVTFSTEYGRRIGFLGMLMDITSRKKAEQKLKASEEKYRTIFENIVDVYYETTLEGEILEVSPSIFNFGGFTREELIGKSMLSFYVDEAQRTELIKAIAQTGAVNDFEIDLLDKNGQLLSCSITSKLERDEEGNPIKIVGTMRDISSRKFADDLLDAERQNLELIATDVPLPEILDSIVRSVETQMGGMLGSILLLEKDGKHLTLGAAPSLHTDYNAAIDGIEIGPEVGSCGTAAFTRELVIVSDIESDPLWAAFRDLALSYDLRACWSQPIISSSDEVLGTFALYYKEPRKPSDADLQVIRGATHLAAIAIERVNIQAEQRDLEAQMRQAQKLESLGILAGGIAHDFNNLLTGIMGYASLAAHSLSEEGSPALQQVNEIQKISERAAALIKQMLAYSGKGKFVVAPLNLSQIIEELTQLLRISVSKKARLVCNFADDLPAVEADSSQVQQIVMNLITNASEALGDDNGDIVVGTGVIAADREYLAESRLDTHLPEGRYVFVEVSDTGCGMSAETLSKIFDPFFTTKFTGRGLGMSATLGIMRGHKGTIKIDSTEGIGTTIRLLFPCLEQAAETQPFRLPDESDTSQPDWRGHGLVLVVDDEEIVREMAGSILSSAGYRVETAVDGRDCLEVYARHRDDVVAILLDLTMPRMNGAEVLRELRSRDEGVPVVLSSGYEVQEAEKRLNGEHFEGFLQKPYLRAALIDKIKEVVSA